jgi:beta-galactosidase
MKLGVCYYPELWTEDQWLDDAQMMHRLGLSIVRIGEFSWYKLEPVPGKYNWEWLDRVLIIMASEGLEVILSTPTAVPPVWLLHQNPEIMAVNQNGLRDKTGGSGSFCYHHPLFLEYSRNVVSELVDRYWENASVKGWQVDNKLGSSTNMDCYCDICANKFRVWLQARYLDISILNSVWGTEVAGQFYSDWDEMDLPVGDFSMLNPTKYLDYRRFRSDSIIDFQNMQVQIIKGKTSNQFVTHNIDFANLTIDNFRLGRDLDLVSFNSFPTAHAESMTSMLYAPWENIQEYAYDVGDPYITGFLQALARGIKKKPYWVMEQQCGQTNLGNINPGIRAGAIRLWSWHAVASGAEAVIFDRWRACSIGQEQYQAGLLLTDGNPDIGYKEVTNLMAEAPVVSQLSDEPLSSNIAILTSYEDNWALCRQGHRKDFNYWRVLFGYYLAFTAMGISVDFVPSDSDLENYRLVIAPLMYLTDENKVLKLESFVARGGTLLFGTRSGFIDESTLINVKTLPGLLRGLIGATVTDWQSLPDQVRFSIRSDVPGLSGDAGIWIEAINPDKDEAVNILARYLGGPLSGKAGFIEHEFGAGSVYYLGFYPTNEQLRSILRYLVKRVGSSHLLDLPDGVIVKQRGNNRIAFNFTRNEKTFVLDDKMITLPPRDFRFFLRDWS